MLEDLDLADDIILLPLTMNHLQSKTIKLEDNSAKSGIKLNAKKCKVLKVNSKSEACLTYRNSETKEVDTFTYFVPMSTRTAEVLLTSRREKQWPAHPSGG